MKKNRILLGITDMEIDFTIVNNALKSGDIGIEDSNVQDIARALRKATIELVKRDKERQSLGKEVREF